MAHTAAYQRAPPPLKNKNSIQTAKPAKSNTALISWLPAASPPAAHFSAGSSARSSQFRDWRGRAQRENGREVGLPAAVRAAERQVGQRGARRHNAARVQREQALKVGPPRVVQIEAVAHLCAPPQPLLRLYNKSDITHIQTSIEATFRCPTSRHSADVRNERALLHVPQTAVPPLALFHIVQKDASGT